MSLLRPGRSEILVMDEWINVAVPSLSAMIRGLQAWLIKGAEGLMHNIKYRGLSSFPGARGALRADTLPPMKR